jgi:hypothetical protein
MAPCRRYPSSILAYGIAFLLALSWAAAIFPGHSHSALKPDLCATCSASDAPATAPVSAVAILPPVEASESVKGHAARSSHRFADAAIRFRAPPPA